MLRAGYYQRKSDPAKLSQLSMCMKEKLHEVMFSTEKRGWCVVSCHDHDSRRMCGVRTSLQGSYKGEAGSSISLFTTACVMMISAGAAGPRDACTAR